MTFGVISLVGEEQARRVEVLLRAHMSPTEYERRRIICGNAAHFQGDERDVMFLSVVDAPRDGPLSLRVEPLFKKRFNVAASRGRDQMWVVHSLNPQSDLKPDDLRRRLIEHALDPNALTRLLDEQLRKVDQRSVHFEGEVLRRLIERGYRVIPQLSVGFYRIDMVVEGGGRRLAVECDGDRYHPLEKLPEDMARQAILERLGWTFVRIRGSVFFRDPERAMQPVFTRLAELGIPAEGREADVSEAIQPVSELKDRVIRRAEELVREWGCVEVSSAENSDVRSPVGQCHGWRISNEQKRGNAPSAPDSETRREASTSSPGASDSGSLNSSGALREGPGARPPSDIASSSRRDGAPGEKDKETKRKSETKQAGPFSDPRMNEPRNWQALFLWARRNPRLSPTQEVFALEVENALGRRTELRKDQRTYAEVVFEKALRFGFIPPIT